MEGWTQRLFTTLVLAVVVLLVAFGALAAGLGWPTVTVIALTLFAAMVAIQLVVEMRRDVRMLKNQALELSGYESEIGRRVDYLASLVERSGGAAPDELAKRVRVVNHQYAQLSTELGVRLDRIEEELAELALAPPARPVAVAQVPAAAPAAEAPRPATVIPMKRPQPKPEAKPPIASEPKAETAATPEPPAVSKPAPPQATERSADRPPERTAADWRRDLASDRLSFHLLPALALPDRNAVLYEAVMRLKLENGEWLEPDAVLEGAGRHGLASMVERKTLYTAARMLRSVKRMGKDMRLLAPLSKALIADERGFEELRTFLEAAPDLRDGLTLEITQSDFRALAAEARQRIGLVADAGFALSLGAVRDTGTDPQTLRQLGFTLARAPAAFLAQASGDTSFAVTLASHRIDLVATGVADESMLVTLVDRDVALAQGPALSAPRLVKPDLLQAQPVVRTAATNESGRASAAAS